MGLYQTLVINYNMTIQLKCWPDGEFGEFAEYRLGSVVPQIDYKPTYAIYADGSYIVVKGCIVVAIINHKPYDIENFYDAWGETITDRD